MSEDTQETAAEIYEAMSPVQRFMFLDRWNNPGPMSFREHVLFAGKTPTPLAEALRERCRKALGR